MSIGKYLKKYLIAGLLVWLPIAVTIWLIGYIINATDWLANLVPQKWQPETFMERLTLIFCVNKHRGCVSQRFVYSGISEYQTRFPPTRE